MGSPIWLSPVNNLSPSFLIKQFKESGRPQKKALLSCPLQYWRRCSLSLSYPSLFTVTDPHFVRHEYNWIWFPGLTFPRKECVKLGILWHGVALRETSGFEMNAWYTV
jgi:hypothetical protein